MRIISQDGTIDLPYEQVTICRFQRTIYFCNANLTGVEGITDDITIASYSTPDKAQKAMEMLREKYLSYLSVDGGVDLMRGGGMVQPNIWIIPKVFQFPQDSEV